MIWNLYILEIFIIIGPFKIQINTTINMKRIAFLWFYICVCSMIWAKDYLLVIDFTDGMDMSFTLTKSLFLRFPTKGFASV